MVGVNKTAGEKIRLNWLRAATALTRLLHSDHNPVEELEIKMVKYGHHYSTLLL